MSLRGVSVGNSMAELMVNAMDKELHALGAFHVCKVWKALGRL